MVAAMTTWRNLMQVAMTKREYLVTLNDKAETILIFQLHWSSHFFISWSQRCILPGSEVALPCCQQHFILETISYGTDCTFCFFLNHFYWAAMFILCLTFLTLYIFLFRFPSSYIILALPLPSYIVLFSFYFLLCKYLPTLYLHCVFFFSFLYWFTSFWFCLCNIPLCLFFSHIFYWFCFCRVCEFLSFVTFLFSISIGFYLNIFILTICHSWFPMPWTFAYNIELSNLA